MIYTLFGNEPLITYCFDSRPTRRGRTPKMDSRTSQRMLPCSLGLQIIFIKTYQPTTCTQLDTCQSFCFSPKHVILLNLKACYLVVNRVLLRMHHRLRVTGCASSSTPPRSLTRSSLNLQPQLETRRRIQGRSSSLIFTGQSMRSL